MQQLVAALLLGWSSAGVAHADETCLPRAFTEPGVLPGEPVRLLAVHPDDPGGDALASDVGVKAIVATGLQRVGDCWFRGDLSTPDGRVLHLERAAVQRLPKEPPPPPCPEGALYGQLLGGTRVRVLAIHPDTETDALGVRYDHVGRVGYVDPRETVGTSCWHGLSLVYPDGETTWFHRVALAREGDREAPRLWFGPTVDKGERVRILEVHGADLQYPKRDALIGQECVAVERLSRLQPGWYSGPLQCADGSTLQFYKVGVSLPDRATMGLPITRYDYVAPAPVEPCPDGAEARPPVPGTRVRIVALGSGDAQIGDAARFVGRTGVGGRFDPTTNACWVRGHVAFDDGTAAYFREVAVALDEPECPVVADRHLAITEGTWLELVAVHPDDARYDEGLVGERFVADGPLLASGRCWSMGTVRGADGAAVYFAKAAFRTLSDPCPTGASRLPPPPDQRVRILAIAPEDDWYGKRGELLEVGGRLEATPWEWGSCWMSGRFGGMVQGSFTDENATERFNQDFRSEDTDYRFYKVAVAPEQAAIEPEFGARPATGPEVAPGATVVVLDVDVFDAAWDVRDDVRGASCVAKKGLVRVRAGWYAGTLTCPTGEVEFGAVRVGVPR